MWFAKKKQKQTDATQTRQDRNHPKSAPNPIQPPGSEWSAAGKLQITRPRDYDTRKRGCGDKSLTRSRARVVCCRIATTPTPPTFPPKPPSTPTMGQMAAATIADLVGSEIVPRALVVNEPIGEIHLARLVHDVGRQKQVAGQLRSTGRHRMTTRGV